MVRFLTDNAPLGRITDLLDHLPMDDAAEVISESDPKIAGIAARRSFTARAPDRCRRSPVPCWPIPSARPGDLMTDKFALVTPGMQPLPKVLDYLRRNAGTLETVNEIYVAEPEGVLLGVCTVQAVLLAESRSAGV